MLVTAVKEATKMAIKAAAGAASRDNPAGGRLRHLCRFAAGLALMAFAPALVHAQDGVWTNVFNGKDLTGLKQHGKGTVKVTDGLIDVEGGNGYLYTEKDYAHYRVKVEWKNLGGGNSGFLYHVDIDKHACGDWPSGPELQMAQNDVGSIWTTDCKFNSTGAGGKYAEDGAAVTGFGGYGCGRQHFIRPVNKETVGAWNTWELYVKGDSMETTVNGTVVMRISKLSMGGSVPMVKGKMGLQIEGSHVQWRNWQVMDFNIPAVTIAKRKGNGEVSLRASRSAGGKILLGLGTDYFDMEGREIGKGLPISALPKP
jgi:Domain of Unknown Function (DUF1080)